MLHLILGGAALQRCGKWIVVSVGFSRCGRTATQENLFSVASPAVPPAPSPKPPSPAKPNPAAQSLHCRDGPCPVSRHAAASPPPTQLAPKRPLHRYPRLVDNDPDRGGHGENHDPFLLSGGCREKLHQYFSKSRQEPIDVSVFAQFFWVEIKVLGCPAVGARHLAVEVDPFFSR
jgi:hypothetical protein